MSEPDWREMVGDEAMPLAFQSSANLPIRWQDIAPADAVDIDLSARPEIDAPLNEAGERCPWPWEPQQLVGVPMGQYHCPYCGAMCVAGAPHPDYRDTALLSKRQEMP